MKQGIKKHGENGKDKMVVELTQLHDRDVFCPVDSNDLTAEQKEEAMRLLMFLKEKRDKSLKGRACADGRKQQGKYEKEDTTSPTVALESVLITSVVDAHEKRDVAVVDILGAFLHTAAWTLREIWNDWS